MTHLQAQTQQLKGTPRGGGYSRITRAVVATAAGLLGFASMAQEVIPDFYKEAGISPNRNFVNQSFSEHVDPFTGALQLHYVDVHVPGNGGFDLSVRRSYNSVGFDELNPAAYSGIAGLGWNIHFGRVLNKTNILPCSSSAFRVDTLTNPVIETPDGGSQMLVYSGSASPMMYTTQRWKADCASGGNGIIAYSPDGTRYEMTQQATVGAGTSVRYAWYTTRIVDRNNNWAAISYAAGTGRITSISTSDSRSISFAYNSNGLVSSITAPGATYEYRYTAISGVAGSFQLTSVIRPGGTSWEYQYNAVLNNIPGSYALRQVTYPEGGSIDYSYGSSTSDYVYFDSVSNPASRSTVVKRKTVSTGGTWTFSYTPGSNNVYDTTSVSTPSGTITYRHVGPNYASSGSLWRVGLLVSKQMGSARTETYSWSSQVISNQQYKRPGAWQATRLDSTVNAPIMTARGISQSGANYTTSFSSFDSYGNPQTVAESGPNNGSRTTTLSYFISTSKWIIRQVQNQTVSSGGVSITRSFDVNGNMLSMTRDGVETSHGYDSEGNVTRTTFPRNLTHTYSDYYRGIARAESQPESVGISRTVSDAGNVTSETNGENRRTSYGYDGLNRVTSIVPPRGSSVSISYGTASKTATRGSLTETTSYDGFGRARTIRLGDIARSYNYDALGRMTYASNPCSSSSCSGPGTNYSYDILDRLTGITNADNTSQGISYGAGSKTVRDERNNSTTYNYRSFGDPEEQYLMSVSAPVSTANVTITRNAKYLVTGLTQDGVTRGFGYDSRGYLTSATNPETNPTTTTFGRDAAGNMTSKTFGGLQTGFTYDGQNRLRNVDHPGSTPDVSKTYSRTHKLRTVNTSIAAKTFNYDANDNLESEVLSIDGLSFTTTYGYNGLDQVATITYPRSGRVVNYSPNVLGRPTQVSGFISSVSYWPSGQVNQIFYANSTVSTYGQNSRLWPSTFVTSRSGGSTYVNSSYGYDGVGNLTSIGDSADSTYNRTVGYDAINRLTSISGPWGTGTISYNGRGNITGQSLGSFSLGYSYDGSNRLSSVSGSRAASYGYDSRGNVTAAGPATYAYDGGPNMTCANCSDAVNRVDYTYDGLNQRVSVTKAGVKTYEIYGSHGNLLAEFVATPTPKLTEYIYLGGKRIAQVDPTVQTMTALTASPTQATSTQNVVLSATVTGSSPTGSVTFFDGATSLGTIALSGNTASLPGRTFAAGSRSVTATYSGDANNATSTSSAVQLLITGTSLYVSNATVTQGNPVYMVGTVTGNSPTGTVTFRDNGAVLATSTLSPQNATSAYTSVQPTISTVGTHNITVEYSGDGNNPPSVSPAFVLTVVPPLTQSQTALNVSSNPASTGSPVTLTATVTGSSPTGTVTFFDGGTSLGTATLSGGQASLTRTFTTGEHTITATYGGDANNTSSSASLFPTGSSLLLHMDGANGATAFPDTSGANNVVASVTAPVTTDTANPRFGTASGNFTGGYFHYAPSSNWDVGPGNFTVEVWAKFNSASVGARAILYGQADSSGANGTFAISKTVSETLSMLLFTDTGTYGFTGTSTVSPNVWYHLALVRAGNVLTLYVNGVAQVVGNVSGTVPYRSSRFGVGVVGDYTYAYGGTYGTRMMGWLDEFRLTKGVAQYTANFTPPVAPFPSSTLTVLPLPPGTVTLSASPLGGTTATEFTFTASVAGTGPTGTVSFVATSALGTRNLGTVTVLNGAAVLRYRFAEAEPWTVTANYSGDSQYAASTSSPVTVSVRTGTNPPNCSTNPQACQ